MTIGERVKKLRTERGWTQKQLAEKCGYTSLTSINKIELGINNVPLSVLEKIAEVFGVQPAYLMGWTDNPDRELSDKEKEFIEAVKNMSDEELDKMYEYLSFLLSKRK